MKNQVTIIINTDNDAFIEDNHGEIVRILESLVNAVHHGREPSLLYDINGNKVGSVKWNV